MAEKEGFQPIDLFGINNLLSHLVAKSIITHEEQDGIIQRIIQENDMTGFDFPMVSEYGQSDSAISAKTTPGYVIQSWLRSGTTLTFLNL